MHSESNKTKQNGRMMSGFIGGTFSLTLSAIIVKFIGLIYKIPICSMLGDEGMGYFNSAYTVYAFFYLLCTAGVPKAVMILISRAKAEGNSIDEERIFRVASRLFFIIGGVITIVFLLFSGPISVLIGNRGAFLSMLSIAPSIVLVSLSGVIRGYLSANTKLVDISVSQVIEGVGKLCFGLAFTMVGVKLGLSLKQLSSLTILGVTAGSAFGLLYLLVCSKIKIKREKTEQNIEKSTKVNIIKRILSISVPITISAAIMSITNLIDLGLIMRCLLKIGYTESEASALYGNYTTLAVPMFNLAISVIAPISVAFLPVFTRCFTTSDREGLKRAEKSAFEITSILSAPMMIGLIVYAEEILSLLFPSSDCKVGGEMLVLIAPAILFSSLLLIVNTVLEAGGTVKAPLISMGVGSLMKIFVSYYIIVKTDLGIYGAPIGTVISYAVALLVSIIIYGKKEKSRLPLIEASFLPHLLGFISVFLSKYVYHKMIFWLGGTPSLVISIALAALIYLVISMIFGLIGPRKFRELAKYTKLS